MKDYPIYRYANEGVANCLQNRWAEADRLGYDPLYTPPSRNSHYRGQYRHDSTEVSLIYNRDGTRTGIAAAETELRTLLAGQLDNGQIPNQQHTKGKRRIELENIFGNNSENHSNYGQPAQEAQSALEIYHSKIRQPWLSRDEAAKEAYKFLSDPDIYDRLVKSYRYLDVERSNGPDDKITGVIMPEETGCDSRPDWDSTKPGRLARNGPNTSLKVDAANTIINYYYRLSLAKKVRDTNGNIAKAREIFWVNDLEMNCIYVQNLYIMAQLASYLSRNNDLAYFSELANQVESQILKPWQPNPVGGQGMWHPEAREGKGAFYSLDKNGLPLTEITHTNLAVLMLPNLSEHQLSSTLNLMLEKFDTKYGLPTVATSSLNYDPHYGEKESIWRGPDWANQNRRIAEALLLQINRLENGEFPHRPELIAICKERLSHLSTTAIEKLHGWAETNTPVPEFSDPDTGKAYRQVGPIVVKWFAWGNAGYVMPSDTKPNTAVQAILNQAALPDLNQAQAQAA